MLIFHTIKNSQFFYHRLTNQNLQNCLSFIFTVLYFIKVQHTHSTPYVRNFGFLAAVLLFQPLLLVAANANVLPHAHLSNHKNQTFLLFASKMTKHNPLSTLELILLGHSTQRPTKHICSFLWTWFVEQLMWNS